MSSLIGVVATDTFPRFVVFVDATKSRELLEIFEGIANGDCRKRLRPALYDLLVIVVDVEVDEERPVKASAEMLPVEHRLRRYIIRPTKHFAVLSGRRTNPSHRRLRILPSIVLLDVVFGVECNGMGGAIRG